MVENKSCLVLIDIEGAELGCLKGSKTLLNSANSLFLIEISFGEHQPQGIDINPNLVETFSLMFSHGYEGYTADENLRRIEINEISEIAVSRIDTLGTHNFVFTKDKNHISKIKFAR